MVDIGGKQESLRTAVASSRVVFPESVYQSLVQWESGGAKNKKGPVFQTAVLAGIQAAKKTSELIPLCHPLRMNDCQIQITLSPPNACAILCRVTAHDRTGVEMEALTGVSVAALTVYDMCKALSHDITIENTQLRKKTGGKHGFKKE